MSGSIDSNRNISALALRRTWGVWWASYWRCILFGGLVGLGLGLAEVAVALAFFRDRPDSLPLIPEGSILATAGGAILSAVVTMFALREALLLDYTTFSFTVLERGSDEPGRIHQALGSGRMLRIWWAAAWPLYLLGFAATELASRLQLPLELDSLAWQDGGGWLSAIALFGSMTALSVACLWRALRKQYRDFRLVTLRPWAAQSES